MNKRNKYGLSDDGYKSHELIKVTTDDWKPNLPGNKIKVRASFRQSVDIYIVYFCAIGASNYRFELEFQTTIRELADKKYQSWVDFLQSLPDEVGKHIFIDLGMAEKEV
jgi:hypothetical protein